MKIQNSKLKIYINSFYFPDPSWENLPVGFPNCDTSTLSKEENHLFEAIKIAWLISHPKPYLITKFTQLTMSLMFSSIFITVLTMFLYYANITFHLGLTFLTEFFA